MMAMISPAYDGFQESLSTLKFATRAKKIKNTAKINEDVDQRTLLRKYESELKKLKAELAQKDELLKQNDASTPSKYMGDDEKAAAISALTIDLVKEREERRKVEEKINSLNS